jgi:hypothetical protein
MLQSAKYCPNEFSFFPKEKLKLAELLLSQDSFKKSWQVGMRTIAKPEFASSFWK